MQTVFFYPSIPNHDFPPFVYPCATQFRELVVKANAIDDDAPTKKKKQQSRKTPFGAVKV
jgi:hypothetical protein